MCVWVSVRARACAPPAFGAQVLRFLERDGVAPARLEAVGFGESLPVASNSTSDGKAQNRCSSTRSTPS
jgi:outer membrane protein OmpA-like peptidoglycan-associated protein